MEQQRLVRSGEELNRKTIVRCRTGKRHGPWQT
jgi:hypothetical protein